MAWETTLNKIRKCNPCTSGWRKLLRHLGKTEPDDEPLPLLTILESNGLDDALWCLRAVEGHDSEIRLFAVWCARQVAHLMTDERSLKALDVAEAYARGEASEEELTAAQADARAALAAARADAWAARAAALADARVDAWAALADAQADAWAAARAAQAAARADARADAWADALAARAAQADARADAQAAAQEEKFKEMIASE